jgi:DNA-binding NarL/FixJ family response regulator
MATSPPSSSSGPLKTFIVEDSPVIRDNLIAALEEMAPVEVVGTSDNEPAAVNWLTRKINECDLVIVDIFLKSGSGLGVLKAVQDSPSPPKMVVLSNYATSDVKSQCRRLGADRVFDKSRDIDALLYYCSGLAGDPAGRGDTGSRASN